MRNSLFCKHRFFYLILLLSFGFTIALKAQILAGDKAPSLSFLEPLASDNITAPYSYDDQVTVVYFWATWCAPCIASFPRINELVDQFSDEISFVSITAEARAKVHSFFDRGKVLKGIKLIDNDTLAYKAFGIESIPIAFIVGKNGVVLWRGNSKDLTEDLLQTILDNDEPTQNTEQESAVAADKDENAVFEASLFSFIVSTADTTIANSFPRGRWQYEEDYFIKTRENDGIVEGIAWFLNINHRTRIKVIDPQNVSLGPKINYYYKCGNSNFRQYENRYFANNKEGNHFLHLMGETLQFKPSIERNHNSVWVLSLTDSTLLQKSLSIQKNRSSYNDDDPGNIEMVNMPLSFLAQGIERNLNLPIDISPALSQVGSYDFSFNATSMEALQESLLLYGLRLIEEDKEIEILVLDFSNH